MRVEVPHSWFDVYPRNWIKVCIFLDEDGKTFFVSLRECLRLYGLAVPALRAFGDGILVAAFFKLLSRGLW
jgi:hypothetical protein